MKKLFIAAMMCLMGVIAQAQVITSETINNLYLSSIVESGNKFAYNAESDDDNNITTMYVYRKIAQPKGEVSLEPVCRYQYEYAADGLLKSRTKCEWKNGEWQCTGRLDYTLMADLYTVEYSRWNAKTGTFDEAVDKMSYTLYADSSELQVAGL